MTDAGPASDTPLGGSVVVDLSTGIAGGYCTKILADGGAEILKVEAPAGDPLRRWSASGAAIADGDDGALFQFLAASKQSIVADPARPDDLEQLRALLDGADAVVWTPGSPWGDLPGLRPSALAGDHPHLTVTAITPFGLEGPWCDRAATEFTLQAWSGGIIGLGRGDPERAPVFVGGQVGQWLAGTFAAVGTLVAGLGGNGWGGIVDVSVLEALALCLTYYPVTYADALGRPFRSTRSVVTPGVGMAKDGMIGVGVGTGQQWLDFCAMVGHLEWMEDRSLFRERTHLAPVIDQWFADHTVDEIGDLAGAFRLPHAVIATGANMARLDHFESRHTFAPDPTGQFLRPQPPWRMRPARLRAPGPAPSLGAHGTEGALGRRPSSTRTEGGDGTALPLAGLRVLDMTAFWAGPLCTHVLGMLGAEVIHVESTTRLDGTRLLGAPMTEAQWWERSPIFSGINTNKLSLTLDFRSEAGMDALRRLLATTDVVVENFTPRVLDQAGLSFETMRAIRSDIILVRMPGFGLDGPWRDNAAFAYTIEDASGLTWMTGHGDQKPLEPYGVGDPTAGMHALVGLLLALEHRRRTGEGVFVESAMVDAAVNITAEQVIEYSAYGTLLARAGNRGPTAAPQNLYRTAGTDERGRRDCWVALAVETDEQWDALVETLGRPRWATAAELSTHRGRVEHHDLIDRELEAWCAPHTAEEVVDRLWPAGVPVAVVTQPHHQGELPQLQARRYFETVDHPVFGPARHSTLPMRFWRGPDRLHRRHAPLLGEHNTEILAGLGLSEADITALEAEGVIGTAPAQGGP